MPLKDVTGAVLAGGRGERMRGLDKGLIELCRKPLVAHVLDTLRPQVAELLIIANRNLDIYRRYGCRVSRDLVGDYWGPLAGMVSAMALAGTPYILIAPCDTPFLPDDLALRLYRTLKQGGASIAVAHDGERLHHAVALIDRRLREDLEAYLEQGGRKARDWLQGHAPVIVDFSDRRSAFENLNHPEDCARLETRCVPDLEKVSE